MIENRAVGIKSRELYEAPAAISLIEAHRALEDLVLTKASCVARELEPKWTQLVYDGLWFSPARGVRRLRSTRRRSSSTARCAAAASRDRSSSPAAARSTRSTRRPRLVRHRRDLPARGGGGVHQHRGARDGARGRARSGRPRGVTLWSARVGGAARARGRGSSSRGRRGALVRLRGDAVHARRLARPGLLSDDELAEVEARSSGSQRPASGGRTRTSTPRSSDCSARSGARSTRAGPATTRSPPRSGSTSSTPARRRTARSSRSRAPSSTARRRRPRRRCPATRTCSAPSRSPSATTFSRGSRCSSATARASHSPPRRPSLAARQRRARRLDAAAAAARGRPVVRNSLDAVADRDFALDYLYALPSSSATSRASARSSCLWVGRVRLRPLPESAATGSSMMPQKLNPDVAELTRGKAGHRDRPAHWASRHGQGPPARLQPGSAGGQGRRCSLRAATSRGRSPALTVLVAGLELDRETDARACADPAAARHRCRRGARRRGRPIPGRARAGCRSVREGTFAPPAEPAPPRPRPGGVREAAAAARRRLAG